MVPEGHERAWRVWIAIAFRLRYPINKAKQPAIVPEPIEDQNKPLQRLLGGFIRLHVLHHAAEEEGVVGNWMIEELRGHGYRLSPGTLYPILHAMEEDGWLKVRQEAGGGRRRIYRITREGRKALGVARVRLGELLHEVGPDSKSKR